MNAYDVILPKEINELIQFYAMIMIKLNRIWAEYTDYCVDLNLLPKTSLIFPILFAELDFYETLLARVRVHLPEEIIRDLEYEQGF